MVECNRLLNGWQRGGRFDGLIGCCGGVRYLVWSDFWIGESDGILDFPWVENLEDFMCEWGS
jgi:hypothetical protein